jgi:hypothetical protein
MKRMSSGKSYWRRVWALFAVTVAALGIAAPAVAQQAITTASGIVFAYSSQYKSYIPVGYQPNMIYRGSYLLSCTRNADTQNYFIVMNATCKDENGQSRATELFGYEYCLTDVWNNNGHLNCRHPAGRYEATCRNESMTSGPAPGISPRPGAIYLYAECKNEQGSYQGSYLNAQVTNQGCIYYTGPWGPVSYTAQGNIDNINGQLQCTGGQVSYTPPPACVDTGNGNPCTVQSGSGRPVGGGYTCGPEGANLPGCEP